MGTSFSMSNNTSQAPEPFETLLLGRVPYRQAHQKMQEVLAERIAGRRPDTLILCEHPPVYTVGRRKNAMDNLLVPGNVPIEKVERGGDITFHGPGQLVGYPIVQLPPWRKDLRAYLRGLEQFWMDYLSTYNLNAERDPRNTGVWIQGKKMVAIGVSFRRWVSWHGFSWNIDVELSYFQRIHPCGMSSDLVTRLSDHVSTPPSMSEAMEETGLRFSNWWQQWRSPEHLSDTQNNSR